VLVQVFYSGVFPGVFIRMVGVFSNPSLPTKAPKFVVKREKGAKKKEKTSVEAPKHRVQHDYYSIEVANSDVPPQVKSPFNISGVVAMENTWTVDQCKEMIKLLDKKRLNSFVFVHKHVHTDSWKEKFQGDFGML
jgi:hypothetical protein